MADNVTANEGSGGASFAAPELSFSGDTVKLPISALGILSGSEGAWTYTLYTGGAGAVTAGTPRVTLASDDPAVSTLSTINGKITACNTGAVVVSSSALPSGAATAAKQPALGVAGTASSDVLTVQGIASMTALKVDGSAVTQPISGSLTAVGSITSAVAVTDNSGSLTVDDGGSSITVDNGGTFAVQAAQSGTWTVGLSAAQTLATVTTVSTVSTLTGGGVAHDAVDSGNPVKIGGRAVSSLASATMVAAADRADFVTDLDGVQIVRINRPAGDHLSERVTNTDGAATALTVFGATAGAFNVITAVAICNTSATAGTVDFRDGTGGSVLYTLPIPAGGGVVLSGGGSVLFENATANTALAYDVSAALSTVTISLSGYKSKI